MVKGPTQTLSTNAPKQWQSSRAKAFGIRAVAFLLPLVGAWFAVSLISTLFLRLNGIVGVVVWIVQGVMVGSAAALLIERFSRRLIPLAALFQISLVFPDEAPSRFGMALRSGSAKKLSERSLGLSGPDGLQAATEEALILVSTLARHDRLTRGHSERVRAYSDLIAQELGIEPSSRNLLAWASLLHDIGKVDVPTEILRADGRPTDDEWKLLAAHPVHSARILEPLADWLGEWIGAATEHHERFDGDGYPHGLAGEDISLSGRIVCVADAFDTMTSKRSYKAPSTPEDARQELLACAGSQFDPAIVRAFLSVGLQSRWKSGRFAWLADLPGAGTSRTLTGMPSLSNAVLAAAVAFLAALSGVAEGSDSFPDELAFQDPSNPVTAISTTTTPDSGGVPVATDDTQRTTILTETSDTESPTSSMPGSGRSSTTLGSSASTSPSSRASTTVQRNGASTTLVTTSSTTVVPSSSTTMANQAPAFNSTPAASNEWFVGQATTLEATATDPDGDTVDIMVTGAPDWLTVSRPNPGQVRLSPNLDIADLGVSATLTLVASDGQLGGTSPAVDITINVGSLGRSSLAGSVVITEIYHLTDFGEAEFLEIWNRGATGVPLNNLVLSDYAPGDSPDTNYLGSFRQRLGSGSLAPDQRLVLKLSSGLLTVAGGAVSRVVPSPNYYLESTGDDVWLFEAAPGDPMGMIVDFAAWHAPGHADFVANQELTTNMPPSALGFWSATAIDIGAGFPDDRGYTLSLGAPTDTDNPACWVVSGLAPPGSCAAGFTTVGRTTPGANNATG